MRKFLVLVCVFAITASASATLYLRGTDSAGGQLIYDDQQDVTWYDFNLGSMVYLDALTWIDELSVTFNDEVLSDWRLPHLDPAFNYYNNSPLLAEMGLLFYNDLGLTSGVDYTTEQLNDNVFDNLQPSHYWTDMLYMSHLRYVFSFHNYTGYMVAGTTGQVGTFDYRYGSLTMAVMDGDVAPETSDSDGAAITNCYPVASGFTLEWIPVDGWDTVVQWSTNLVDTPFTDLSASLPYPVNTYTDTVHGADSKCFYRVELEP